MVEHEVGDDEENRGGRVEPVLLLHDRCFHHLTSLLTGAHDCKRIGKKNQSQDRPLPFPYQTRRTEGTEGKEGEKEGTREHVHRPRPAADHSRQRSRLSIFLFSALGFYDLGLGRESAILPSEGVWNLAKRKRRRRVDGVVSRKVRFGSTLLHLTSPHLTSPPPWLLFITATTTTTTTTTFRGHRVKDT